MLSQKHLQVWFLICYMREGFILEGILNKDKKLIFLIIIIDLDLILLNL